MRRLALLLLVWVAGVVYYRIDFRPGDFEVPYFAPQPKTDTDAREWRILALIIEETALERLGGRAVARLQDVRFTSDERGLIRRKHREFEYWLAERTGGRLRAETDVLEVPGPITSLSLARGDPTIHVVDDLAYWAAPSDVAPLVQGRFPAGRYQMILAWVKLPQGVKPGGGALTSPTMLRGSPFSSHFWGLPGRRYIAETMFAGISHEFYHQITFWLTRELEYDRAIFPSNHPPNTITVDGEELLPAGETRRLWYTHVLSNIFTDAMWDAMLNWQREAAIWNADNLAYGARPIGGAATGEVRDLDKLNDGSLGSDRLRDAAASHPPSREPVEAWFGLEFDQPTTLSRVTAYPRFHRTDASYLARRFVLEYEADGRWQAVRGTSRSGNEQMKVDFEFSPITVRKFRLRILDERPDARGNFYRASCLELEAYR
jgi:hypothetical protein